MSYPPPPPNAPIPVAPLDYTLPPRRGRPGIITAMGVISIVVACITGLANVWGAFAALGFFMMSRIPPAAFAPPPPSVVAPLQGISGTALVGGIQIDPSQSEDGISEELRPRVITGMTRSHAIDGARTRQLDLLLAVAGESMFPFVSSSTTPQTIRVNVTESGRLPSASGGSGPDYFIIGTGRVEVYDAHAIFRPDGSADVVSVMAPPEDDPANPPPPPPSTPSTPASGSTFSSVTVTGPGGTTTTTTTTTGGPMLNPAANISPIAAGLSAFECLLSVALAVYLLVIGILTLRDSRRGGMLHWIYVVVKIPLVGFAVAVNVWLMSGFMSVFANIQTATPGTPAPAPAMNGVMIASAIIGGVLALAYPLALIFVLMSRTVRDYYGPVRAD